MNINFFLFLFLILLLNIIFIKKIKFFSNFVNVFDKPDGIRKIHNHPVPILGGFFFIINLIIIFTIDFFFNNFFLKDIFSFDEYFFFLFSFLFFFILGFLDDKFLLRPSLKLIASILIIGILIQLDKNLILKSIIIDNKNFAISLFGFEFLLTVLCFLLFQNAFNMFDGTNLQIANYSIIIIVFFFIKTDFNIFFIILFIPFIFYWYLNYKNLTFLGDGGTLSLSFIFSVLFIKLYNSNIILNANEIFNLMLIPGFDMLRLFIFRILNKKNPFYADNNHLHHLLLKKFQKNYLVQIFLVCLVLFSYSIDLFFRNTILAFSITLIIYLIIVFTFNKKIN